jgi:hypothetical protein
MFAETPKQQNLGTNYREHLRHSTTVLYCHNFTHHHYNFIAQREIKLEDQWFLEVDTPSVFMNWGGGGEAEKRVTEGEGGQKTVMIIQI